jgi:hypothetical protein
MRNELPNLGFAHLAWMAFLMKENVSLDPTEIRPLGTQAEMAHARNGTDFIEEPRLVRCGRRRHDRTDLKRAEMYFKGR